MKKSIALVLTLIVLTSCGQNSVETSVKSFETVKTTIETTALTK